MMTLKKKVHAAAVGLCLAMMLFVTACGGGSTAGSNAGEQPTPTTPSTSTEVPSENSDAPDLLTSGTLTIGVDATYPPFESFENNKMVGMDIELGEALAAKLGLKTKWVDTRFEGLISGLNAQKYDVIISAISITPERQEAVDFVPYFSQGQNFVGLKDSGITIEDVKDIEGLNIAVLIGSVHYNLLNDIVIPELVKEGKGNVKISSYPTTPEAVQQVIKGTADVALLDSPVAGAMLKQFGDLQLVSPVLNPKNAGIVVRKGDTAMAALIEKGLKELEADGTLAKLYEEYGVGAPVENLN